MGTFSNRYGLPSIVFLTVDFPPTACMLLMLPFDQNTRFSLKHLFASENKPSVHCLQHFEFNGTREKDFGSKNAFWPWLLKHSSWTPCCFHCLHLSHEGLDEMKQPQKRGRRVPSSTAGVGRSELKVLNTGTDHCIFGTFSFKICV